MTREPDPFEALDRAANAPINYCPFCETEVSRPGFRCGDCAEKTCSYCGEPSDGRWCSRECRAADESDRG